MGPTPEPPVQRDSSAPLAATEARKILATWLSQHPDALVGALSPNGIPTGMPDGLGLSAYATEDRSVLDLVIPEDSPAVTDGFVLALRRGISVTRIHLVSDPDTTVLLQYVDLREEFGVVLRLLVPSEGEAGTGSAALSPADILASRPRLGFMTKDEVATILAVDDAALMMLGWPAEAMIGHRTLEFIHPDDHVRAIDNWMARRSNHSTRVGTVRLRYLRHDGSWLWVETSNEFVEQADGSTVVTTRMIDISSEMAASEALRRSEELLRRVADTVPVGLFHIAVDGDVVFVNPVAQRLFGEVVPHSREQLCALLAPGREAELDDALMRVLDEGVEAYLDLEMAPVSGSRSACQVTLRPVVDQERTTGVLGCVVDVTELKQVADTDALTGLESRRAIMQSLTEYLSAKEGCVAAVFVDLDRFKPVNDEYGHGVGDRLLTAVADRLRRGMRPGDRIGRLGGDEFLVVCPGLKDQQDGLTVAERIRAAFDEPFLVNDRMLEVGASIGVSCSRGEGLTADELVAVADSAMYRSKHDPAGRPVLLPADTRQAG
ncbi:MAG TPA: diguanylate cyclase [Acidimicrobiales bacterium]|nr:diguanylate cyclase [Acidimicrobiales bacterium]